MFPQVPDLSFTTLSSCYVFSIQKRDIELRVMTAKVVNKKLAAFIRASCTRRYRRMIDIDTYGV